MKKFGLGMIVLAGFALSACDPADLQKTGYERGEDIIRQYAGEGACLDCFGLYSVRNGNKAFALSESGTFGYSTDDDTEEEAKEFALRSCQARNAEEASKPCRLLMVNDVYTWN